MGLILYDYMNLCQMIDKNANWFYTILRNGSFRISTIMERLRFMDFVKMLLIVLALVLVVVIVVLVWKAITAESNKTKDKTIVTEANQKKSDTASKTTAKPAKPVVNSGIYNNDPSGWFDEETGQIRYADKR